MKKIKYREILDELGEYTICNVARSDALCGPCRECFSKPPIHISRISFGSKKPINDSLLRYCEFLPFYENDHINEFDHLRQQEYTFIRLNLIAILREDLPDWKLIGVEVTGCLTFLCIANTQNFHIYYAMLKACVGRKLKLLFEAERNDSDDIRLCYSLRSVWGLTSKIRLRMVIV